MISSAGTVMLNGERVTFAAVRPLANVLAEAGIELDRGGIAVALNDRVVPRRQWSETEVHPGDRIEVVSAVAGG